MSRTPVQVIPNPIPKAALAMRYHPNFGRRRVLMVCNGWSTHKNPEAALIAFSLLAERLRNVELVVVGTDFGPGETANQWWRRQGLPGDIVFLGSMSHPDVLMQMMQSDLLLHSSLEESFGAVLAEAMAIGLPIVAGECSGAVPWVVGNAGKLVDVTRPQAMADAMLDLLSDHIESNRISELGRQEARERFSLDAVSTAYEHAYDLAIRRKVT